MKNNLLVLAGAVAGGVLGFFVVRWLAQQGLYAIIAPGALVGLGAGMFKCRSLAIAVACGVLALIAGLLTEWRIFPFIGGTSFAYFLLHLTDLRPITLIMLAVGAFIGFWLPFRRAQDARKA